MGWRLTGNDSETGLWEIRISFPEALVGDYGYRRSMLPDELR
jgi:hypothetical protein